ncbi:MAG: hypothetical protein FD137_1722, partial [Spirochaetes bacterium]
MKGNQGNPDCLIGQGVAFEGSLAADGILRIEGRCAGKV